MDNVTKKRGVPSAVGFPHCAGSGEGLFLSPKPYPHKCAEAGARILDTVTTILKYNMCKFMPCSYQKGPKTKSN